MDETEVRWLMSPQTPGTDEIVAALLDRPEWHRRAACRGMGPETFFPKRGEANAAAKAICAGCPVRSECLSTAVAAPALHGIWAGTTQRGRLQLRRGAA